MSKDEVSRIVFQDPYASFDPRVTAERIVEEPLSSEKNPIQASSGGDYTAKPAYTYQAWLVLPREG